MREMTIITPPGNGKCGPFHCHCRRSLQTKKAVPGGIRHGLGWMEMEFPSLEPGSTSLFGQLDFAELDRHGVAGVELQS